MLAWHASPRIRPASCLGVCSHRLYCSRQDDTLRVSDPLREGYVFSFYHVLWKDRVPPGLYALVMVANDEVGSLVAIRSTEIDGSGEALY